MLTVTLEYIFETERRHYLTPGFQYAHTLAVLVQSCTDPTLANPQNLKPIPTLNESTTFLCAFSVLILCVALKMML